MDYTEASASIAGYGYQFERALYRIFHSTHQDTLFGIVIGPASTPRTG